MTTTCSRCGRNITHLEKEDCNYVLCDHCNIFQTPKGANSHYLKGGNKNMVVKKKISNRNPLVKDGVMKMIASGKKDKVIIEKLGVSKPYLYKLRHNKNY